MIGGGASFSGCGLLRENTYSSKRTSNATSNIQPCSGSSFLTKCRETIPSQEQFYNEGNSAGSTTKVLQPNIYSKYQRGANISDLDEESYHPNNDNVVDCISSPNNLANNNNNLLDV